jgi:cytidyltransferase-like protein
VGDVVVTGSFDDLRSGDIRFFEEAAKLGGVHVLLWGDEGSSNKFPLKERLYFVESLWYVGKVTVVQKPGNGDELPGTGAAAWVVRTSEDNAAKRRFCGERKIEYRVISDAQLRGFPLREPKAVDSGRKKVLVTGCYDWVHTGHVRFFEEVSEYGDVYAVVGHDANIELLKGPGHPHFKQDERCYMVGAIRFVKQAMVSTGNGWLDAEPEIRRVRPDIYAVNEDGDKGEKEKYCREHGIEYLVLKRLPKEGLPRRQSTALRGF